MTPPDDLGALVSHITARLVRAGDDRDDSWRTPALATVADDGGPSVRTVVLRSVDAQARRLTVYTDGRSRKAAELQERPVAELVFWDDRDRQQLRVRGGVTVAGDGPEVDAAWERLAPETRRTYGPAAPGAPVAGPAGGHAAAGDGNRRAFAILTVGWTRWDWLWLAADGHRRCRVDWSPAGKPSARWIVP